LKGHKEEKDDRAGEEGMSRVSKRGRNEQIEQERQHQKLRECN
jgi:hypothetical protein